MELGKTNIPQMISPLNVQFIDGEKCCEEKDSVWLSRVTEAHALGWESEEASQKT